MGRPTQIDRDALHRVLWRRTDRFGRIQFVHQEMAESLRISTYHFSRIMKEGELLGRWTTVNVGKNSRKTYEVVDPAEWTRLYAEAPA